MQTAIYTRLSLERDANAENCAIQEAECREYAENLGWEVVAVFSDSDISASRYSRKPRPGYNELIEAVEAGEVEAILITEMPRLYRRLEELLELMHLAEATNLKRIETTDGLAYDLSTGFGVHNAVAAVNTAMFESRKISDRMKRKRRAEARAGRAHGGSRPYGFEKGGMVVRESEAEIIREAARLVLAGEPVSSVVRMLNLRREPTATGGKWHPRNLEQILTSRRIAGIRTHNGSEYPAAWPAIISREESDRLRLMLHLRNTPGKRTPKSYLLSSMVYCGLCGKPCSSSGTVMKTGVTQRKYRCKHFDGSGMKYGCGKIARAAEPVEALVSEAVLHRCDSEELAAALRDSTQPEISGLMETYDSQRTKLNDLITDYASGLLNREQLARAKAVVEEAMEATRAKLAKVESGRALISLPAGQSVRQAWERSDLTWRRSLVSLLVVRVVLHPSRPGRMRWEGPDGRSWTFDPTKVTIEWRP
jgi:DNA invertase Pin-like site-specific DNA recombinase